MARHVWQSVLGVLLLFSHGLAVAAEHAHAVVGNTSAATPGKVGSGVLLMGGNDRNQDALRWFIDKAGGGHVVVLGATGTGEFGRFLHEEVGGVASVETFVLSSREQSTAPALLAALRKADGIFIEGGHQSRYVQYWRSTPVADALDAHVRAGKPLAGNSAGMAILGEFLYGAMDGGSQVSMRALANPLGRENTIETDFLDIALLKGVITDTHFRERDRLGRLVAYVAKAEASSGGRPVLGLGVDEDAALAIEGDGTARVYATADGAGATVVRGGFATRQRDREPMALDRIETLGVGTGSVLHLPAGRVERPAFERAYAVRDGVLAALDFPVLAIHGGAGVVQSGLGPGEEVAARKALAAALLAGHAQLKAGKPALEAVTVAITVLEDAPQFNAGRGAVFTHAGGHELDTSIMDGATSRVGAAAGVKRTKNPILLARTIMEKSKYVMMIGDGADEFAQENGLELVEPAYFDTEKRRLELQRASETEAAAQANNRSFEPPATAYFGTVGAVALDARGNLAAGTSTGGMNNKRFGRVGDSPIIGAGTWADDRCAVSGTGWGEYYIRVGAAHEICARMRMAGDSLSAASEDVINRRIPKLGGNGGAIALDAAGNIAFPINTQGMYRGWIGEDGVPHVAVFAEEHLPAR